jgi:hypothetical protein
MMYIFKLVSTRLTIEGFVLIDADRVRSQDSVRVVKIEKNTCSWLEFPAMGNLSGKQPCAAVVSISRSHCC